MGALTAALLTPLSSASAADGDATSAWEVTATPYVWATAMETRLQSDGARVSIRASFSDLLDAANFGGMLEVIARKDRWLLVADGYFADLEADDAIGPVDLDLKVRMGMTDLAVGYSLWRSTAQIPAWLGGELGISFDAAAGGRYWHITQEIKVSVPPVVIPPPLPDLPGINFPGARKKFDDTEWWFDGVVGGLIGLRFGESVGVRLVADSGGWGVGDASDNTWSWAADVRWRMAKHWGLLVGYRALSLDRADGSGADRVKTDLKLSGPLFGIIYRF